MNITPPSLGRIVLYRPIAHAVDSKVRPAMIIDVYVDEMRKIKDRVQLKVVTPSGDLYLDASWSEQGDAGTWFWPPRVENRKEEIDDPDEDEDEEPEDDEDDEDDEDEEVEDSVGLPTHSV